MQATQVKAAAKEHATKADTVICAMCALVLTNLLVMILYNKPAKVVYLVAIS